MSRTSTVNEPYVPGVLQAYQADLGTQTLGPDWLVSLGIHLYLGPITPGLCAM